MTRTTIGILLALCVGSAAADPIYVNDDSACTGTPTACGGSWADAYPSIQSALADPSLVNGGEVWVASGTYSGTMALKNKVKVYGGFSGTETLASKSLPFVNHTYLTGNGSSRVINGSGLDSTTVLRGFHIIDGNLTDLNQTGAGIRLINSDVAIVNCLISGNASTYFGAAVSISGGSPTFLNCRFVGNAAGRSSGGVLVKEDGAPTFVNCLFDSNTSMEGGAIGIFAGTATLINCTFGKNAATGGLNSGGGALVDYSLVSVLKNCIVFENTATVPDSDSFYSIPGGIGAITATYSNIELVELEPEEPRTWDGTGNTNAIPQFVDSVVGNFRLQSGSPCLDAGDDIAEPLLPVDDYDLDWDGDLLEAIPIDLRGAARNQGASVDMGAYEGLVSVVPPNPDTSYPDTGDGAAVRYISIKPTNSGEITALRVTFTNLPAPFDDHNGQTMWVGPPVKACPNSAQSSWPCSPMFPMFWASNLRCTPYYRNWSTLFSLYIYDDEFVPGATYDVQVIHQDWGLGQDEDFSGSLAINTSVWGDITGGFDFGTNTWTPPDGSIDLTTDISAVLDAVNGEAYAPHKSRCDLDPDVPNSLVDQGDVDAVVDGFVGVNYPFGGPSVCP